MTNREYLQFIDAGGYEDRPCGARPTGSGRRSRIFRDRSFGIASTASGSSAPCSRISPPAGWPVYVSHAEATAYARWAGKALPTEAQWHRAAYGTPEGTERPYPWGPDAPDRRFGNFDFESWDPTPVGFSARPEHIRRRRPSGQRMGVDGDHLAARSPALSRSNFILATRPIFSTVNTM